MNNSTDHPFADSASLQTSNKQMGNLRVFTRGQLKFAISDDEIAAIVEWRQPTPLPQAPPTVLGVVSIQGRMLTVLNPTVLLGQSANETEPGNFIVALRGDEQLALAVDNNPDTQPAQEIKLQHQPTEPGAISDQEDAIKILDVKQLFGLAIRGRERRRRRF